jgi:hypothetical protein
MVWFYLFCTMHAPITSIEMTIIFLHKGREKAVGIFISKNESQIDNILCRSEA